jgi:hypothetical protein
MSFLKDMNKYTRTVTMPGGYGHNLPDTIRQIDRHWEGKFKGGTQDSQGKYKYWMHTSRPLSEMASKNVDVNTSMIKLIGIPKQSELSTWVMERELRQWLTENDFDSLLNDIVEQYPKFGHVVIKKHKRVGESIGVSIVPIENLRMDPSNKWLKDSGFVGELHRMSRGEILRHKEWDKNEVQRLFKTGKQDYDIYEYYTMEEEGYKRTWYAWVIRPNASSGGSTFGIEANINQPDNMAFPPIKLYSDEVDELPYRELKWSNVAGRWLGGGEMEYLADNQRHDNETGYLELKGLYLKALKIFTTDDDSLGGNVIREMQIGQLIKTQGDLKMVQSDNTDLSAFSQNNARWDKNASQKAFSSDPAGMGGKPNKQAISWLQSNTASYYKKKQENLGIFLRKLLMNDILPSFKDDKKRKHMFTFVGSYADIDQFTKFIVEAQVNNAALAYVKKTGFMPSQDERAKESMRIEKALRNRNNHGMEIPASFYENLVARLEIVITGENKDLQGMTPILQQFLTLIAQNPAVLQNKATRAIAFKILEFSGMQPAELDMLEQQMTQQANSPQAQQSQGPGAGQPDPNQPMKPGASMPKIAPPGGNNAPAVVGAGPTSKQL